MNVKAATGAVVGHVARLSQVTNGCLEWRRIQYTFAPHLFRDFALATEPTNGIISITLDKPD